MLPGEFNNLCLVSWEQGNLWRTPGVFFPHVRCSGQGQRNEQLPGIPAGIPAGLFLPPAVIQGLCPCPGSRRRSWEHPWRLGRKGLVGMDAQAEEQEVVLDGSCVFQCFPSDSWGSVPWE